MRIFALQSLVGGFLDEDLKNFNKFFDDWCVQFECMEDAQLILDSLDKDEQIKVVEITPLSYPNTISQNYKVSYTQHESMKEKLFVLLNHKWV